MNKIETIFSQSNFQHDRFFNESFSLPYDFNNIKIQPNELVSYRTINDSLDKLYQNFLYLYGLTKLSSNAVPVGLNQFYGVIDSIPNWYDNSTDLTTTQIFSTIGFDNFDNTILNTITFSEKYGEFLMSSCTQNSVTISTINESGSSFNVILSSFVADIYSDLLFLNLKGSKITDQYLYVLDAHYNNLYRYVLKGLISDDIFPKQLSIDKVLGGYGIFNDKYKFNNPQSFCILNTDLYVLDSGNFCIKSFDQDFNFKNLYQFKKLFQFDFPIFIEVDQNTQTFFVVTQSNTLYLFSDNFTTHRRVSLSNFISAGSFKNLFISKSFENCYYIVSSDGLFKFYISKPGDLIGQYSLYRFGLTGEHYICAESVANVDLSSDTILAFAQTPINTNLILRINDSINYESVLTLNDFDIFEKSDILINSDEFLQTWTFSKATNKLLLNHLRLKDKIKGRFTGIYDRHLNPVLDGTLYFLLNDLDLTAYKITLDHFIGNNEVLTNTVVNRGLEKIYNIQQLIIGKSNTIIQDSSFFANSAVNII